MSEGGVVERGSTTVKPLSGTSGRTASPIGNPQVRAGCGREHGRASEGNEYSRSR